MSDLIGVTINNYTIIKKLGEGGMGIVYIAHHPDLDLEIAIKVMRPELAEREGFFDQFKREAQTIAKLQNQNIVRIHNFGHHKETGVTYLMMELVDGPTLRALLRDSPFGVPVTSAVEIIEQIARGLGYAHNQGILHLDLKPDNILLTKLQPHEIQNKECCPYRPVISDFGLARLRVAPGVSIQTTQRIGTPHYMSPEQCQGKALNEKSDIYSLGVMLYEVLCGQRPFPVSTLAHAVYYHGTQVPSPPSTHLASLPAVLDELVLTMLAKDPNQRPPTATAIANQLADILPSLTPAPTGKIVPSQFGAVATPEEVAQWSPERAPVVIQVYYQGTQIDRFSMKSDSIIAGRTAPSELLLDSKDKMISKRHCEIRHQNGVMMVQDLNSKNRTFINDQPIEPGVLVPWTQGTQLKLGLFTLIWGAAPTGSLPEIPSQDGSVDTAIPKIKCQDARPQVLRLGHKPSYIGRLPSCDMVIADPGVSKRHCAIFWDGQQVQVKDLGSTNGTMIGENELEPQQLNIWPPSEQLQIGPYVFTYD